MGPLGTSRNPEVVSADTFRPVRGLVLLGEPGIGKSVEVQRHAPFADLAGCDETFTVDLGEYSSEDRVLKEVLDSEAIRGWVESDTTFCITLDSFDEAHSRIPILARLLSRYLKVWPRDRLYVRIACRTAEWPMSLEGELAELFDDLAVYELLPLRRLDVPSLIPSGIDSTAFLEAIDRARAAPLASRPLTLRFLAGVFEAEGDLPENAAHLYHLGLRSLCGEVNPARVDAGMEGTLTSQQRMNIAARLAAFSTLANKASFTAVPMAATAEDQIHIDDCVGGSEGPEGSAVQVDRGAIRESLATGLFSGRQGGSLGWSHATFSDFLAASWVLGNSLSNDQARSLLLSGDGGIYPQVSSIAAWLVAQAPDSFGWLVDLDPQAFVGQVDLPAHDLREKLVNGLFQAAEREQLIWNWATNYSSLAHPSLAEQVRPRLRDQSRNVRRLALDLARDCSLRELADELLTLASDLHADHRDRVEAAWALEAIGQQDPASGLAPLATNDQLRGEDPDDELLGVALLTSWPHALSTDNVFRLITPPRRQSFFGSYDSFLDRFAKSLTRSDLTTGLDWLNAQADLSHHRMAHLANAVIISAIDNIEDSGIRDRLLEFATRRGAAHLPLLIDDPIGETTESPTDPKRRQLLLALAQRVEDEHSLFSLVDNHGIYGRALLREDDFSFLVQTYADAETSTRTQLRLLIQWAYRPDIAVHRDVVLSLSEAHALYEDLIGEWVQPIETNSDKAQRLRDQWNMFHGRRNREGHDDTDDRDADVNAAIRRHLDAFEEGTIDGYWQAVRLVTVRPGTRRYMEEFQPDLTTHARWEMLDESVRDDLIRLAPTYLEKGMCQPEKWLGQDLRLFPAEGGYRALLLLLKLAPDRLDELPPQTWREWAPIIIGWPVTANGARWEDKKALLERALRHAQDALVESLLTLLRARRDAEMRPFIHDECDIVWSDVLEQGIIKLLEEGTSPSVQDELIHTLVRNSPSRSQDLLREWLSAEARAVNGDRARSVLAAMWQLDPDAFWPEIFGVLQEDPEFGEEFLLKTDVFRLREVPPVSENAKADLYLWLFTHFPPSEDPVFDDAHMVGPRESVGQARDAIIQNLVRLGTEAGLQAIRRIVEALPQEAWLKHSQTVAEHELRRAQWIPVEPADLLRLASSRRGRLVRSENELLRVINEALARIQERLQGDTPESHLLWDTRSSTPKSEDEVSDYLRNRLQDELVGRGAVVNREVQVRRLRPSGIPERTDIRVDATSHPSDEVPSIMTVAGEVKGAWNDDLFTSMSEQLVQKYMSDIGTHHGFFLVAWFDPESWAQTDRRRQAASRFSREEIEQRLLTQVEELRNRGDEIDLVILDASYRRPEWHDD